MMHRYYSLEAALFLAVATSLPAQDCQTVFNALDKVMRTPTHMYTSTSTDGKTIETIYTTDGIYTNTSGKWVRSEITLQQATKMEGDNRKSSSHVCHYVKDESLFGERAEVYTTQIGTAEGTIWISKSKGLPLRNEVDVTKGDAPKTHYSVRYDYKNVAPPKI